MKRKVCAPHGLTPEQVEKIAALAKLGYTIQPRHVAEILDVPEERLAAWLSTPAGAKVWRKSRTEGRAELVATIREQALSGDGPAQKLLIALLDKDDTARAADLRLPAAEVRELLGRTARKLSARVAAGEWLDPGPDRKYPLAAILGVIGTLWDRLAAARKSLDALRKQTAAGRMEESEAKRRLAEAQAKRRERENAVAEGRLVDAEAVRDEMRRLAAVVQHQVANLAEAIRLKLGADDAQAETIQQAVDTFLTIVAREMAEPEVPHA